MEPMVSNKFDVAKVSAPDNNGVFKDNNGAQLSKDAATYVVISGAQAKGLITSVTMITAMGLALCLMPSANR